MIINCSECGKPVSDKAVSCPCCGNPISGVSQSSYGHSMDTERQDKFFKRIERIERERYERELKKSDKSRIVYVLLGLFLGWLGAHNFYIGRAGRGVGQLLMFFVGLITLYFLVGGLMLFILSLWVLVDICSVTQDSEGKTLS